MDSAISMRFKHFSRLVSSSDAVITMVMLVFIALFAILMINNPIYEWDLLPYMANAMNIVQELPIDELHSKVYQTAAASIPADAYAGLLGSPSRLVLSEDSEAFRQTMMFFYDARIVYNHLMAGILKLGFNPVFSYYFFSIVCVVISLSLLCKLIPARTPVALHLLMPFIVLSFGLMTVARLATPDALAGMVTIGLYFVLLRNKLYLLLLLLPLVIFIRTDLILLIGIFHAYLFFGGRVSKALVVCSGIATVAAYLFLNNIIVDPDPWSSLLGYNFGEKPTHPADYHFPVSVGEYIAILKIGLKSFSYETEIFFFGMFIVIGILMLTSSRFNSLENAITTTLRFDLLFIIISSALYYLAHFLLFPVAWDRFFAAQYSLVAVVVIWCIFSIDGTQNKAASSV